MARAWHVCRRRDTYERPVMANQHGLVFAWPAGIGDFFMRLDPDKIDLACRRCEVRPEPFIPRLSRGRSGRVL